MLGPEINRYEEPWQVRILCWFVVSLLLTLLLIVKFAGGAENLMNARRAMEMLGF